jgi:peptidoglycan/xylan/chitin deacetylase (PgdA/CDA1 family)
MSSLFSPTGSGAQGTPRQAAKRIAERVLVASGLSAAARWWRRRNPAILAYHNVLPDGAAASGDRSLHLPRARLAEQLDRLAETHEVVALEDILRTRPAARRPRAVVTFDDAYRGALLYGLPELTRRGMAATIVAAPALLGDGTFWWDVLASDDTGEVPQALRDRALRAHRGRQEEVLAGLPVSGGGEDTVPSHSRSATLAELEAAVREHGVRVGSHTWSHPNLTELDDEEVVAELERSREWLARFGSSAVPWLAYPYGLTSDRVARLASRVFDGALSLSGRLAPAASSGAALYEVPRINIPAGSSLAGFELRISACEWG